MDSGRLFPGVRLPSSAGSAFLGIALLAVWCISAGMAADGRKEAKKSSGDDLRQLSDELDAAEEKEKSDDAKTDVGPRNTTTARIRTIEDAATRRRNQAEEQRERLTKDPKWQPTHEQIGRFEVGAGINNFCLDSKGRVLACCSDRKIRVFSQDGKLIETWEVAFAPEAIGLRKADGVIFVGGQGQLAKLSLAGSVLQQRAFPDPLSDEEIERAVQAQMKSRQKVYENYLRGLKAQLAEVEKKLGEEEKSAGVPEDQAGPNRITRLTGVSGISSGPDGIKLQFKEGTPLALQRKAVQQYVKMIDRQYGGSEKLAASIRASMSRASRTARFTGIAVADKDLFVTCSGAGYGYNAWRLNHELQDEQLLVKGLRGCCGQMDCQTHEGDLWIPVNTQHKVYRYDRDGNVVGSFGKCDREAADGFGGCCEPKNLRFGEDGFVYCAESGPPVCVKRFTLDGKFQNVTCFPIYRTGCVRVSVDIAGDKFFMMSPNENAIYVFAPKQKG